MIYLAINHCKIYGNLFGPIRVDEPMRFGKIRISFGVYVEDNFFQFVKISELILFTNDSAVIRDRTSCHKSLICLNSESLI